MHENLDVVRARAAKIREILGFGDENSDDREKIIAQILKISQMYDEKFLQRLDFAQLTYFHELILTLKNADTALKKTFEKTMEILQKAEPDEENFVILVKNLKKSLKSHEIKAFLAHLMDFDKIALRNKIANILKIT